jgi:hypothetical protein
MEVFSMAQFLEARFIKDNDGTLIMERPMELPRMTLEAAAQRGYRTLTPLEFQTAGIKQMDAGFAVMKNSHGELRAVKFSVL